MSNIETKEIQGDDPEYKKNTDELLGEVIRGEIKTYVLVALDDGDVGTILNLEDTKLEDCLKLDEAVARVVAELRHGINYHLANMAHENYLLGKAVALRLSPKDESLRDGLKSVIDAIDFKGEGGEE